jgi:hypothetical protein
MYYERVDCRVLTCYCSCQMVSSSDKIQLASPGSPSAYMHELASYHQAEPKVSYVQRFRLSCTKALSAATTELDLPLASLWMRRSDLRVPLS